MKIEVMVIEDEEHIRRLLGKMIEKTEGFMVISEAATAKDAIASFMEHPVDVAFVDIDLNGDSGLECARKLCDISPKVKIIFATAHSEYMADAFEIYAFDYLVKPFNLERISRTLNKIRSIGEMEEKVVQYKEVKDVKQKAYKDKLAIKGKEQIQFLDTKDICFIERVNGTTKIVTYAETFYTTQSLTDIYEKLNHDEFMRSHRSYIINISKITKLSQYGRWTYTVNFRRCEEFALMTHEKYEKLKERIC